MATSSQQPREALAELTGPGSFSQQKANMQVWGRWLVQALCLSLFLIPHRALGTPSREGPTVSCSSSAPAQYAQDSSLSAAGAATVNLPPTALLGLLLPTGWENLRNPEGPQKCPALDWLLLLTLLPSWFLLQGPGTRRPGSLSG